MASAPAANLHLLRPIRVLLVSPDRRFVGLARLLLSREELLVDAVAEPGEILGRVRDGVEVVVLDGSNALAETAQTVAVLESLFPHVAVVVVCEEGERVFSALPALSKWGSLEQLAAEVRRSYLRPRRRTSLVD
jgi:hypothetical protein